jgi:hypothetical protein
MNGPMAERKPAERKDSVRRKCKVAAWDDDFLTSSQLEFFSRLHLGGGRLDPAPNLSLMLRVNRITIRSINQFNPTRTIAAETFRDNMSRRS